MAKASGASVRVARVRRKRRGVHSKKCTSSHKSSKNWKKPSVGQG